MRMQLRASHFGLVTTRYVIVAFAFALSLFSPSICREARGEDGENVTKEIQELRQQMETMQKKLDELEQKK